MKINLFIYSNIHLLIGFALINDQIRNKKGKFIIHLHISNNIFQSISKIINSGYYNYFIKKKDVVIIINRFYTPSDNSHLLNKIISFGFNFLKFKTYDTNLIIVPNFSNLYILFCLKRINTKKLIYIDEGMSYISFLRFIRNNYKSKSYKFSSFFSKFASPFSLPYLSPQIKSYVFNKENFKKIENIDKYKFNLIELNDIFSSFIKEIISEKNCLIRNKDLYTFIVTSPLSSRKYTIYKNQEVDVLYFFISKYVKENPNRKIIIKTHYREIHKKYNILLSISKNISIYKGILSFQELFLDYLEPNIICFHSSAVFSLRNLNLKSTVYCLCPMIKSVSMRTITNGLKEINWSSVKFIEENFETLS